MKQPPTDLSAKTFADKICRACLSVSSTIRAPIDMTVVMRSLLWFFPGQRLVKINMFAF